MKKKKVETEKKPANFDEEMEKNIEKIIEKMGPDVSKEDKEKHEKLLRKIYIEGVYPREAMGFSENFIELVYTYGYNLYQQGQYDLAFYTFQFLNQVDPDNPKPIVGMASVFHMKKDYNKAIGMYLMWSRLEPKSPFPYIHIANLYEKQNELMFAFLNLQRAIIRCGDDPKYAPYAAWAKVFEKSLVKRLPKEDFKEEYLEKLELTTTKEGK